MQWVYQIIQHIKRHLEGWATADKFLPFWCLSLIHPLISFLPRLGCRLRRGCGSGGRTFLKANVRQRYRALKRNSYHKKVWLLFSIYLTLEIMIAIFMGLCLWRKIVFGRKVTLHMEPPISFFLNRRETFTFASGAEEGWPWVGVHSLGDPTFFFWCKHWLFCLVYLRDSSGHIHVEHTRTR